MSYEELLIEADKLGLITKEKTLNSSDGRIKGNRIAIRKNLPTTAHKTCVLAEELGHHVTTVGDIIDQQSLVNRKQERHARMWAYDNMVSLFGIVKAYCDGCKNIFEMAEYLNVTEAFLSETLDAYKAKYGVCACAGDYIVYFEPYIAVAKIK